MVGTSERVYIMMQNFMRLHEKGYTIPEIARLYDLNAVTVYRHLGEIASDNGVMREELLKVVRSPSSEAAWRRKHEEVKVKFEELNKQIKATQESTESLLEEIKICMKKFEEEER